MPAANRRSRAGRHNRRRRGDAAGPARPSKTRRSMPRCRRSPRPAIPAPGRAVARQPRRGCGKPRRRGCRRPRPSLPNTGPAAERRIVRTPATVAERLRSPGLVLLAWVIGGIVALIGAFCFGELGQRRPRAGGGYVYLRETFGPLPAFLYGWTLVLVIATGAIAAVAVTF